MNFKNYLRPGKGATDITPLLSKGDAFHQLIKNISDLFSDQKINKVACIEGRGFILGSAVAYHLHAGVIPIRRKGGLKNKIYSLKYVDYSGKEKSLEMHRDALMAGEKILIIDDWVETGATIKTTVRLIKKCGGNIIGIGVFMDDSNPRVKQSLSKYNYRYLEKVTAQDMF